MKSAMNSSEGFRMGVVCPVFLAGTLCCIALVVLHFSSTSGPFCFSRKHAPPFKTAVSIKQEAHSHYEVDLSSLIASTNFSRDELLTLASVLQGAKFEDGKTIMVAPLNKAWAENGSMFDAFIEGLKSGEGTSFMIDHLVVFALDQAAFQKCTSALRNCFALKTEGVDFSQEQAYMKADYVKMTKRKMMFLRVVLELGFDFVFTDIDILWFRPPFQHFSKSADVNVACDKFNGRSMDLSNNLNTGIMHARSNARTRKLFEYWHQHQEANPKLANQPSFHKLKHTSKFKKLHVKMNFMSTDYFGGFCQFGKSMETIITMHANCCKGLSNKLEALRMANEDWKLFKSMTPQESREHGVHFRKLVCPRQRCNA